jgi:heme-degrading monooxygenase HmoA
LNNDSESALAKRLHVRKSFKKIYSYALKCTKDKIDNFTQKNFMWLNGKPPEKNYYAVIFVSTKIENLGSDYYELDNELMELAQKEKGFLGWESVKNGSQSIFISYWQTQEDINRWKTNTTHLSAKAQASKWYKRYLSQICKVEHSKSFENDLTF